MNFTYLQRHVREEHKNFKFALASEHNKEK